MTASRSRSGTEPRAGPQPDASSAGGTAGTITTGHGAWWATLWLVGAEQEARRAAAGARADDEELGVASLLDEHRGGVTLYRECLDRHGGAGREALE